MKRWPPSSPHSRNTIRRNHSPFCESNGPIVQEGFVAARIRVLQELQAQAQAGNRSHSPMIPCPPRRVQPYRPRSSPGHDLAHTPASNDQATPEIEKLYQPWEQVALEEHEEHFRETLAETDPWTAASHSKSPNSETRSFEPRKSYTTSDEGSHSLDILEKTADTSEEAELRKNNALFTSSTKAVGDGSTKSPSSETPKPSEHLILGPRPISASLADSSTLELCVQWPNLREDKHGFEYENDQSQGLPRESVADKLDSLVERGWIAGKPSGKVDEDGNFPKSMSMTVSSHDDSVQSLDRALRKETRSHGPASLAWSRCHDSFEHSSSHTSQADLSSSHHLGSPQQRKLVRKHRYQGPKTPSFERSSSDIGSYAAKRPPASSIGNRRAWSLSQLQRLKRSSSEGIELRSFTPSQIAISRGGRRRSASVTVSSRISTSLRSSKEGAMSVSNQHQPQSEQDLLRASSRRSSIARFQSNRAGSRSTPWFKRSWFNPFSGDKQPVLETPSKESVTSTSASTMTDGAMQGPPGGPDQSLENRSIFHSIGGSGSEGEARPSGGSTATRLGSKEQEVQKESAIPVSQLGQHVRAQAEQHSSERLQDPSLISLTPALDSQLCRFPSQHHPPKYAKSSSEQSQASTSSRLVTVPARRSSKRAPTSPSEGASLLPTTPSDARLLAELTTPDASERPDSSSLKSSSSISGQMKRPSVHSRLPPSSAGARRAPRSRAGSGQHEPPLEYVHRGLKGRGRGIKKIQVIISFDGADDLIIETATVVGGQGEVSREHDLGAV